MNNLIFFIGTAAIGHTLKGIDEKEARINFLNASLISQTSNFSKHPVDAIIESCKGERTCLKTALYAHFKISSTRNASIHPLHSTHEGYVRLLKSIDDMINRFASTGKNDSKPTEKKANWALNLPKLSQNGELENPLRKGHGKMSFPLDRLVIKNQ